MTPEAQRIKIAESCGWRFIVNPVTEIGGYWEKGKRGESDYRRGDWGSYECAVDLPDYLSDLNAMHEAEKVLCDLSDDVSPWDTYDEYLGANPTHATAAHRAEAFLKTLGLWKD